MENRRASVAGDLQYFTWYFGQFPFLYGEGFFYVAYMLCYLPMRTLFGTRGRTAVRRIFAPIARRKTRSMPFPIGGKRSTISLRDLSDFDVFHEICIRDFYGMTSFLRPGMTVVDAGANIGTFSIMAGTLVGDAGKVVSFEIEPENYALMKHSLEANHLNSVILNRIAVSDYNGNGTIQFSHLHEGHSLIKADPSESAAATAVTTIDSALEALGIRRVDVLKIDVEGSELEALAGATDTIQNNPSIRIMIDIVHYPGEEEAVAQYLKKLGFASRRTEDYLLAKRG